MRLAVGLLLLGALFHTRSELPASASASALHTTAALARWEAQGIQSYDLAVAVDVRGRHCFQHVRVRRGAALQISDTCAVPWLGTLTVPQIFAVAQRIAALPQARCQPTIRDCVCQRAFQTREFTFDRVNGVPALIYSRSDVAHGWQHAALWRDLVLTRVLPTCAPAPLMLRIKPLWFVAIVEG